MWRIPEPDLMNDSVQAQAYAQADFSEPHNHFVTLFLKLLVNPQTVQRILDLGCGPGDICIRMAKALPDVEITGVDGAAAMLALGHEAIKQAGLTTRVRLLQSYLPTDDLPRFQWGAITSNSLLHHLADPLVLWQTIKSSAQPGTHIFVMDLMRPASEEVARRMVDTYAQGEAEILRHDFYHSLLAAYRPDEVMAQLATLSITCLNIEEVSDRHFTVQGVWA